MTGIKKEHDLLRFSVIFVWLFTALASLWELHGQSAQLLAGAEINDPRLVALLVWGGACVDAALGLAMWVKPGRWTYFSALGMMLLMTLVATILEPALWLHPLGPLTKNVPMAAALWLLAKARA